jgi:hypothetical protein
VIRVYDDAGNVIEHKAILMSRKPDAAGRLSSPSRQKKSSQRIGSLGELCFERISSGRMPAKALIAYWATIRARSRPEKNRLVSRFASLGDQLVRRKDPYHADFPAGLSVVLSWGIVLLCWISTNCAAILLNALHLVA